MENVLKNRFLIGVGLFLICSGIIGNTWTVTRLISPDGMLESKSITFRIWITDVLLILIGGLLIIYRKRIALTKRSLVFGGIGLACMIGGILLNEWILARLLGWYGDPGKISAWIGEGVLILFGMLFLIYRDTLTLKAIALPLGSIVLVIYLLIGVAEFGLRLAGYRSIPDFASWYVLVQPGGKMFMTHPTLGYRHLPGEFNVTFFDGYSFHATHLSNTLRATHPIQSIQGNDSRPEVWIFGCSFTYGFGINDEETYPWLLQEQFPLVAVSNFGVSGYGTVQSLIQFQEAIQQGHTPQLAILAYGSFHDERNILSRERRNSIASQNRLGLLFHPYARLDSASPDGLRFGMGTVFYYRFPLAHDSAFIALLDKAYGRVQERWLKDHEVSRRLIRKFAAITQQHGTKFIVAGINADEATHNMLVFCKKEGILAIDIAVDLTLRKYNVTEWDPHPNALANREYADRLADFIIKNKLL